MADYVGGAEERWSGSKRQKGPVDEMARFDNPMSIECAFTGLHLSSEIEGQKIPARKIATKRIAEAT